MLELIFSESRWKQRGSEGLCAFLLSPVLLCGILLLLRFPGLISQALLGSGRCSSRLFLSFSFSCSFSLTRSLSLFFSLSLCFFDFFLDLLLADERLLSAGPSWTKCPGDDVTMLGAGSTADAEKSEGGWLSLSDTAVSWESQSLPLWLESLLTSDSASKGRGMSSTGSGWELDDVPLSDVETASVCAPPASPLPLEELSLPLTGAAAALLARCDILGFLLTRGSMKSAAGRFWQKNNSFSSRKLPLGLLSSQFTWEWVWREQRPWSEQIKKLSQQWRSRERTGGEVSNVRIYIYRERERRRANQEITERREFSETTVWACVFTMPGITLQTGLVWPSLL